MEEHFNEGVNYFLISICPHKASIIEACKKKYPELNGRGVNFVFIDPNELGRTWQWGFFVDPGRYHMSKSRIREAVVGMDDETVKLIENAIDQYNPDNELLFCFISGGLFSIDIVE
jgi:hypothetical protein